LPEIQIACVRPVALLGQDRFGRNRLASIATFRPNSKWRAEAERRASALATTTPKESQSESKEKQESKPPLAPAAAGPDEVAWSLIKDTKDPDLLRRFIAQFPQSPKRAEAEQKAAALSEASASPAKRTSGKNCFSFQGREFCQ
jgi:hypothetical protein